MADLPDLTLPLPAPDLVARVNATENRVAALEEGGGSGSGIQNVSGTVDLPNEPGLYEVYAVAAATVEGVSMPPGAAGVFRYHEGTWTVMIVGQDTTWQPASGYVPPPEDTTPPTGATLAVSGFGGAGSTRTLTVAGATDPESGLHATPYGFSLDGGVTWSTYQASSTFTTDALTEGTYSPRARVRNASPTPDVATVSAPDFSITAPREVVVADTFDRANSGTLGTTTTGAKAWTEAGGDFEIWANSAKITNGLPNSTRCFAHVDSGQSDVTVSTTLLLSTGSVNTGLLVRYVDTDNYVYVHFSGASAPKVYIQRYVGGVNAQVASSTSSFTLGNEYLLSAHCSGSSISVSVDGVEVVSATVPELTAATRQGLYAYANAEDNGSRWRDFEVRA